jgi:hypothetical protein
MKARYIEINGKQVRIEFNWNTTIEFLERCGIDLDKFVELSTGNKITPRHIRQLAWSGAIEGERLDGRELEYDEIAFGSMLYPGQIKEVLAIFADQFSGMAGKTEEKKKKGINPLIHFRTFR